MDTNETSSLSRELDKHEIAEAVVQKLMESNAIHTGSDFTVNDIMNIFKVSKNTATSCQTGRYYFGGSLRFRREEILYFRKMGLPIKVKV